MASAALPHCDLDIRPPTAGFFSPAALPGRIVVFVGNRWLTPTG
jgi:hypothetical protein